MSLTPINIALDGHSSCGKSSTAKLLAKALQYVYVDTGAMYRMITLFAFQEGCIQNQTLQPQCLIDKLPKVSLSLTDGFWLNGVRVDEEIRAMHISAMVSQVSALAEVRQFLLTAQQALATNKGVVMDGRDIGTVVLPDAELKVFMTAKPEIRAQRRWLELKAMGKATDYKEILSNLMQRDEMDSNREIAPLKQANDAILLDTSNHTLESQVEWIKKLALEKINNNK